MTDPLGDGHLDLDALADLDEGLLTPGEAAAHQEHLHGCQRCREDHARLRSTRALLAALPADPMPVAVADRIDTALLGAAATVIPIGERRRRSWRSHPTAAGLGAAAAVVALVVAIVIGTNGKPAHRTDSPQAAAGARSGGVEAKATFAISVTGRKYTPANAGALVAGLARRARTPGPATAPQSGTAVQSQVAPELLSLYNDPAQLMRCVNSLVAGDTSLAPVAVDFGRFTDRAHKLFDRPAVVVVLSGVVKDQDAAYIVGPGCSTAPDNNIYLFQAATASAP